MHTHTHTSMQARRNIIIIIQMLLHTTEKILSQPAHITHCVLYVRTNPKNRNYFTIHWRTQSHIGESQQLVSTQYTQSGAYIDNVISEKVHWHRRAMPAIRESNRQRAHSERSCVFVLMTRRTFDTHTWYSLVLRACECGQYVPRVYLWIFVNYARSIPNIT